MPDVTVTNAAELYKEIASAKPGMTILLREGNYLLEKGLEITLPITLFGSAESKARAVLDGQKLQAPVITIETTNVTIRDLNIVGGTVGIHLIGVRYSNVWNSVITKSLEAGIWLQKSSENEISHNTVSAIGGLTKTPPSGIHLSAEKKGVLAK